MSYMTISSQEKHNFSLCSCFHAHPTTLLLKILGGPMHGRSPHLKFWGDRPPQSPLGLRPWSDQSITCLLCLRVCPFCQDIDPYTRAIQWARCPDLCFRVVSVSLSDIIFRINSTMGSASCLHLFVSLSSLSHRCRV